jgi:predicted DCC family thiol-disulfide oxidoreductase YuxK
LSLVKIAGFAYDYRVRKSWRPRIVDDTPERVILFDGVCVLCSRWARFVMTRDPEATFRFVAVQDPYGQALAQRLGIDTAFAETNAMIVGGRAYFKSDAAIEVLSRLPHWAWVRLFRLVPSADISHYLCMMASFCGSIDRPFWVRMPPWRRETRGLLGF